MISFYPPNFIYPLLFQVISAVSLIAILDWSESGDRPKLRRASMYNRQIADSFTSYVIDSVPAIVKRTDRFAMQQQSDWYDRNLSRQARQRLDFSRKKSRVVETKYILRFMWISRFVRDAQVRQNARFGKSAIRNESLVLSSLVHLSSQITSIIFVEFIFVHLNYL